jgi:hypothetical protein
MGQIFENMSSRAGGTLLTFLYVIPVVLRLQQRQEASGILLQITQDTQI